MRTVDGLDGIGMVERYGVGSRPYRHSAGISREQTVDPTRSSLLLQRIGLREGAYPRQPGAWDFAQGGEEQAVDCDE